MANILENDNELFQNSIKYLHTISNTLGLNLPALKSSYLTKARLMELRRSICLPSNVTKTTVRCQRCFINFIEGPASYKLKVEQKKSRFAKRLLARYQSDKSLTKYQRKYLKKLDIFNGNQLAITCKFCKKESFVKLQKPKKLIRPKVSKDSTQKKKKLKKKDKFCGLNRDVVLSLTPQNATNLVHSNSANGKKNFRKEYNFERQKNIVPLTPRAVRNLDDSNYSSVKTNVKKVSTFKLSRKENATKSKSKIGDKNINKDKLNLIKKSRNLNKLSELLNTSKKSKASPSSNLKHFLQSL